MTASDRDAMLIRHDEQLKALLALPQTLVDHDARLNESISTLTETVGDLKVTVAGLKLLPKQVEDNTKAVADLQSNQNKVLGAGILLSALGTIVLVAAGAVEVAGKVGEWMLHSPPTHR
jgi:hypothetical protein